MACTRRYHVIQERTDAHDHFYCADYEWRVVDVETGEVVAVFDERATGGEVTGAARVELEGNEIVITDHDGTVQRRPLP
jgi:hypothetical protein